MWRSVLRSILLVAAAWAVCPVWPWTTPWLQPDNIIRVDGAKFTLHGKRFRFVGVNIYSLLCGPRTKGSFVCGLPFTDAEVLATLDEVKAMGANAVRIQAYRSHLRDASDPKRLDFSRLDLVVEAARARGIRLIVTLENQWWDCSRGGYRFSDWYAQGYKEAEPGYPMSYRDYVAQVAAHFRGEPAILAWQLMNEAESKTPKGQEDPEPLLRFTDDMIRQVHRYDPTHLVDLGTIGLAQPGSGGPFFALLHVNAGNREASDFFEVHDYDQELLPDRIDMALRTARLVGKPFIIGEMNLRPKPGDTAEARAEGVFSKMVSSWAENVDGILLWSYRSPDGYGMTFARGDALYQKVHYFTEHYLDASD